MYERMLDKKAEPSMPELVAHCGICGDMFADINGYLTKEFETETEIRFPYGNHYGWSVKHKKKSRLICDIFAEADAFTVMLRLTDKQFAAVYDGLLDGTKEVVDNRYPCGEGGWIHYRVTDRKQLEDAKLLLRVKLGCLASGAQRRGRK